MNERWKYQIKIGLFWGIFMSLFNVLFEIQEKTLRAQFTSTNFYLRLLIFCFFGVFVLGYMNWRANKKNKAKK